MTTAFESKPAAYEACGNSLVDFGGEAHDAGD